MNPAISIEGLGKRYRIGARANRYGRLTESVAESVRSVVRRRRTDSDDRWFWALHDVSFEVGHGVVIGVVGRNGAGKSTLLKVLSRITPPSTGQATLRGRVGALLEVGTGFHPELTGRENISLSGAVLGMSRKEIVRKLDEIVAFAEIEQFLDTPVKRYSSGMQVRLGFAVAAHMEPEILIVDEVLAVGDAAFQKKCLAKMEDVTHEGRTVLFVSHNMAAVESLCTEGVLFEHGAVAARGSAHEVVNAYLQTVATAAATPIADRADRQGDGRLRIVGVDPSLRTGGDSEIRLSYQGTPGLRNVAISIGLFTTRGDGALYLANELSGDALPEAPAVGVLVCRIPKSGLLPGRYSMNVYCTVNGALADWVVDAAIIDVAEGDFHGTGRVPPEGYGSVGVVHTWSVE